MKYRVLYMGFDKGQVEAKDKPAALALADLMLQGMELHKVDPDYELRIEVEEHEDSSDFDIKEFMEKIKSLREEIEELLDKSTDELGVFFDAVWREAIEGNGIHVRNFIITAYTVESVYHDGDSYDKKVLILSGVSPKSGDWGTQLYSNFEPNELTYMLMLNRTWKYYNRR